MIIEDCQGREIGGVFGDDIVPLIYERPREEVEGLLGTGGDEHLLAGDRPAHSRGRPGGEELLQGRVPIGGSVLQKVLPVILEDVSPFVELVHGKNLRRGHSPRKGDHPRLFDQPQHLPDR